MDSKILSFSKTEFFMTIFINVQQLTIIAKISPEFLHQPMAAKDDYYHGSLLEKW